MEEKPSYISQNLIIAAGAFLAGVVLSYIVFMLIAGNPNGGISQVPNSTNNQAEELAEDFVITANPSNADENIATISRLGLSFRYSKYAYSFDEDHPGLDRTSEVLVPKLSGNVISFGKNYASSVSVYDKESGQSLETAIKNSFLQGVPETSCQLIRIQPGSSYQVYAQTSGISYVVMHELVPGGCPSQFDTANPSSTFFSFATMPAKFFFAVGESDGTVSLLTANGEPFWVTMKFSN